MTHLSREIRVSEFNVTVNGDGDFLCPVLPISANGWSPRPFQIVSLLDMLTFDAGEFMKTMLALSAIQRHAAEHGISGNESDGLSWMTDIEQMCARYEIDVSGCAYRIREKIVTPNVVTTTLDALLLELRHRISDELRLRSFLFMPTEDAKCYEQDELFGSEVAHKFRQADAEIAAAGNCYATGNYTACVFHLMRVVEIGARFAVKELDASKYLVNNKGVKVPVELCDWHTLIQAMEKGLTDLSSGSGTNRYKKRKFEHFNHAVAAFRNFKDAWRNHVSHTREMYQAGKAKDIMDNTRQFMQHLATRSK